jgi:hypothetical protein
MLARCRAAATARGLEVALHHQSMETMRLGRRYRSIFLAWPTFNLLPDDDAARRALERIREHLAFDGAALIPLFMPRPTPNAELGRPREHVTADGCRLRVTTIGESRDERARLQTSVLRYEVITPNRTDVDERPWVLHWHTVDGFGELVRDVGLRTRSVRRPDGSPATPTDDAFVFRLTHVET